MSCVNIFHENLYTDVHEFCFSSQDESYPFPTSDDGCCNQDQLTYRTAETSLDAGGVSEEWIQIDFGKPVSPYFLLSGMSVSSFATIELAGSPTNDFDGGTPEYCATYGVDDTGLLAVTNTPTDTKFRYWRFTFTDPASTYIEFSDAFFSLTQGLDLPRGGVQFPVSWQKVDRSTSVISEAGCVFTDIRPNKTENLSLSFSGLNKEGKEKLDYLWDKVCLSKCFVVQLDPEAVFSSSVGYYTYLVKFASPPSTSMGSFNFFDYDFDLQQVKTWHYGSE